MWNECLAKFSTFYELKMIKHDSHISWGAKFVPLSFDVIFRSDFTPCINVWSPSLLLLWGWVLNACLYINALAQDQSKYAYEQTIDNFG
jgi:hypothetical protein